MATALDPGQPGGAARDVLRRMDDTGLVPADEDDRRLLVDIYAMKKALYEVRYELANRPDWVSWPMTSVMEMLPEAAVRR
jgi:predicted trehalose synthase